MSGPGKCSDVCQILRGNAAMSNPNLSELDDPALANCALVISCEHGGNQVPLPYYPLFAGCYDVLDSHRGYDPGALVMARALANQFGVRLLSAVVSRLVVDLNRSPGHRHLHIRAIARQPQKVRQQILASYYYPYRNAAERLVAQGVLSHGRVIHVSCHSFTPKMNNVERRADIGLLYDPARERERALCMRWQSALGRLCPDLVVRRNYPYRGSDDGLTTALRQKFPPQAYLGIELELNQKHLRGPPRQWAALRESVIMALAATLQINPGTGDPL